MYRKRLIAGLVSIFTLGVVFGILMKNHDGFSFRALFVTLAVISVIYLVVASRKKDVTISKRMTAAALVVAAFSLGVIYLILYTTVTAPETIYSNNYDVSTVKTVDVNSNSVDAYVIESDCVSVKGKLVRIYIDNISTYDLISGDSILITAKFHANDSIGYLSNGISIIANGTINKKLEGSGLFYSIRKSVSENSKTLFDSFDDASSISKAVTSGDRSGMDSHLFSIYKSAGISHVLAISGLHISLIALSMYNFLLMLSFNRKVCCVISSLAGVAYAALVGFTPGVVRSVVMLLFLLISRMFLRRSDGITALFCALLILLIVNPYSISSAGLQLSFLCSLGIIISEPLLYNLRCYFSMKRSCSNHFMRFVYSLYPAILTSLLISFVSAVFSFPVLCLSFDTVSYISPVVNLIAVPLFSTAVKFALASFMIVPISGVVAKVIAYPAGVLFDLVTDIARWIYDADIGSISVHIKYMYIPLMFSFAMIASLIFLSRKRNVAFAFSACVFCASLLGCGLYNQSVVSSTYVSEYHCDGNEYVYYQTPKSSLYIDLGGYTSSPDVIYKNGMTSLEKYVLLKYDSYTFSRFDYISGNLKVKEVHLPEPINEYQMNILCDVQRIASERNCKVLLYTECFEHTIGDDCSVQIFGKDDIIAEETIICVKLTGDEIRYLCEGYDRVVKCDVAVLLGEYGGDIYNISADDIYSIEALSSSDKLAEKRYVTFDNNLKIVKHSKEREMVIYEP